MEITFTKQFTRETIPMSLTEINIPTSASIHSATTYSSELYQIESWLNVYPNHLKMLGSASREMAIFKALNFTNSYSI